MTEGISSDSIPRIFFILIFLSGGRLLTALDNIKAVLFFLGSIGLIIGAITILRKDREKENDRSE